MSFPKHHFCEYDTGQGLCLRPNAYRTYISNGSKSFWYCHKHACELSPIGALFCYECRSLLTEHNIQTRRLGRVGAYYYCEVRPEAYCCNNCGGMWTFLEYWTAFFEGVEGLQTLVRIASFTWLSKVDYFRNSFPRFYAKHFNNLEPA